MHAIKTTFNPANYASVNASESHFTGRSDFRAWGTREMCASNAFGIAKVSTLYPSKFLERKLIIGSLGSFGNDDGNGKENVT